jgi:hypothetical protein
MVVKEKGKQRADDIVTIGEQHPHANSLPRNHVPESKVAVDIHHGFRDTNTQDKDKHDPEADPDIQPNMSKRKLRPNRNQGILQAVQAHLGTSIKTSSPGGRPHAVSSVVTNIGAAKKDVAAANNEPVQTSSLSAEDKTILRTGLLSDQRTSSNETDTVNRQSLPAEDPGREGPKARLSGPDIMARTRARLAKLKNEPVAGVPPTADLNDPNHEDRQQSSTGDDIRARLLNRLEEEKRQIISPEQVPPQTALLTHETNMGSTSGLDSQAAEAKLRMQAQVRVRLAAEKRAAEEPPLSSPAQKDVMNGANEEVAKGFGGREESLRAKLREKRQT